MLTEELRRASPKPVAAGVIASMRSDDTELTSASRKVPSAPNSTCSGLWKPSPMMETGVPPSLGPVDGVTERITGWVGCSPPGV